MSNINSKVSDIFKVRPTQFGLRGDVVFWDLLYSYYINNSDKDYYLSDITLDDIYDNIAQIYKEMFNEELFSNNEYSYNPNINNGGMSGGFVSHIWWNTVGKAYIYYQYTRLLYWF